MDGSSSTVIVMPIALIALFTGIALAFIAGSRSGRSHAAGRLARPDALKRIRAGRRKARAPEPGADDAAPAEYLYIPCARSRHHGYPAQTRWVQEVPIVKKTAKWIYYTSETWDRREAVVGPGRISRQEFETDTRCHEDCPGISPLAWSALRTAAATGTARMAWPRAATAARPAAAGKTARQTPAECAAPGPVTPGTAAHARKVRAVTDTRPA